MASRLSKEAKGNVIAAPKPPNSARTGIVIREPHDELHTPLDTTSSPMTSPPYEIPSGYPSVSATRKIEFTVEHFYDEHAWKAYNNVYKDKPIKIERNVSLNKLRDNAGKKLVEYIEKNNGLFFTRMEGGFSPDMVHYFYSNICKVYAGYFEVSIFSKDYLVREDDTYDILVVPNRVNSTGYMLLIEGPGPKLPKIHDTLCVLDSYGSNNSAPTIYATFFPPSHGSLISDGNRAVCGGIFHPIPILV
ncbi:uncharacterized protein LOC132298366 [Cornus florida]|uniref:uncharacterized protein LOC132298366 n=1 Tax=Cornus florida TaxID=4283 RepID=UPI00289C4415|nr:uncharacterized protein LOC132298366 [Cornus florida]